LSGMTPDKLAKLESQSDSKRGKKKREFKRGEDLWWTLYEGLFSKSARGARRRISTRLIRKEERGRISTGEVETGVNIIQGAKGGGVGTEVRIRKAAKRHSGGTKASYGGCVRKGKKSKKLAKAS